MAVRIVSLELENVKRVALVRLEPSPTGLTVIGGDNRQGKTSVLDGIGYALGGERFRPTNLQREGSAAEARIEISLSNGLVVSRSGKNAALKVTDPTGAKAGQKLLDSFCEELALNLPKFLAMTGREKAGVLLRILGIGDQLAALDREEKAAYDERTAQGRVADQKLKYAREMPEHHDCPETPVSAADLVAEAQAVMARNAERQAARQNHAKLQAVADRRRADVTDAQAELERAQRRLAEAQEAWNEANAALQVSMAAPVDADESTAEIERRLDEIEATNAKVRANLDKRKAVEDAEVARGVYAALTAKVEDVRARRLALLEGAAMPLPGLSVENGELTYLGKAWDCMSSAEQIRAGVAIVRKLKPECGFVLLDGLERFDLAQLNDLGAWLEAEGLQAIATRVSRGDECAIIIVDGMVAGTGPTAEGPSESEMEY